MKDFIKTYAIGLLVIALLVQPYYVGYATIFLEDADGITVYIGGLLLEIAVLTALFLPYKIGVLLFTLNDKSAKGSE